MVKSIIMFLSFTRNHIQYAAIAPNSNAQMTFSQPLPLIDLYQTKKMQIIICNLTHRSWPRIFGCFFQHFQDTNCLFCVPPQYSYGCKWTLTGLTTDTLAFPFIIIEVIDNLKFLGSHVYKTICV